MIGHVYYFCNFNVFNVEMDFLFENNRYSPADKG